MTTRERMVEAAFALFDEQGYDATTVEQVVERAGVSRSTFFRAFGSKEDVIFPRHDELQGRIEARLATGTAATVRLAVTEAARLVLEHYVAEGALAHRRYALTRTVPALRDREVAGLLGYQRLFRDRLREWLPGPAADLHAELLAAAVVTAHNVVLRRWLRGDAADPFPEFEDAMEAVFAMTTTWTHDDGGAPARTAVVVVATDRPAGEVAALVERALGAGD
ncbi:TetR/AcrR family transcriptional regulator [Nocardioides litoris]|uniref:TetR/AcrR family transcriptional regulator n=1 Tax=Nocardioides litoris TaxID=1926648 RepID=UPI001B86A111|nr:TetR/AcrR family transcriptional regulator [Nocardioides litoris]